MVNNCTCPVNTLHKNVRDPERTKRGTWPTS